MICEQPQKMMRPTFTIAVALLCATAGAAPLVTFESHCECLDNHGVGRWSEKMIHRRRPQTILSAFNYRFLRSSSR